MKHSNPLVIVALSTQFLLVGCASTHDSGYTSSPPINVVSLINDSAKLIHNDLMQLNKLRQANSVVPEEHHRMPKDGPLAQKVTLNWTGPAHEPVKFIADLMGWQYRVTGMKPSDPFFVTVNAVNEPAFKVLEDIATQMGTRGGVDVEEKEKLLVVDYRAESEGNTEYKFDDLMMHGANAKHSKHSRNPAKKHKPIKKKASHPWHHH